MDIIKKNMKSFSVFRSLGIKSLAFATVMSMCACSDDDEPGAENGEGLGVVPTLPTPEYEASSAKFEITSSSSNIGSIELTASGDYLIMPRMGAYYHSESESSYNNRADLIRSIGRSRAGEYNGQIIHGKFVKLSDTEYILEDFGSIVIEGDTSNAFSLQITPSDGVTTTVSAKRASTMADSQVTDAVCRTWNLDNIGVSMSYNNVLFYNGTKPASQLDALMLEAYNAALRYMTSLGAEPDEMDPYEPLGYYPKTAILTKAGTYMIEYSNGTLAVSTWHWKDESKGVFHYSWDYNNPDSNEDGVGGDGYISFDGNKMTIKEVHSYYEDGETLGSSTTYGCSIAE